MNVSGAARSDERWDRALLLWGGVFAVVCLVLQSFQPLNHDSAWYLVAAKTWTDGSSLYRETGFDPNPPMVVWLSAGAVHLGRLLGIAPDAALRVLTVMSCLLSAAVGSRVLRTAQIAPQLRLTAVGTLLALTLSLPQQEFGQREHVLTALIFPYLCLMDTFRGEARFPIWLRVIAGSMLGMALCVKPQYLLVPVLIVANRARQSLGPRRWLAWQEVCAAMALAAYLVVAFITARPYFEEIVPLASAVYYTAYAGSFVSVAFASPSTDIVFVAAVFVTMLAVWRAPSSAERSLAISLCLGGASALFAFLIQRTGWVYQGTPARVLLTIAFLCSTALCVKQRLPTRFSQMSMAIAGFACVFGLYRFARGYSSREQDWASARAVLRLIPRSTAPMSLAAISTSLPPAFPAVLYFNGSWAMRYPCLWMLPAVIASSTRDHDGNWHPGTPMRQIDEDMRLAIFSDFERNKPSRVLVERAEVQQALKGPVDLLAYLLQDDSFQRAWLRYHECAASGTLVVYCRN